MQLNFFVNIGTYNFLILSKSAANFFVNIGT